MSLEQLASAAAVIKEFQRVEVIGGFPRLRRTPSSTIVKYLDYFAGLDDTERAALLDANARIAALNFMPPRMAFEHLQSVMDGEVYKRYRQGMVSPQFGAGLRYWDVRTIRYAVTDPEAIARWTETRSRRAFVPRDDPPPELVPDPDLTHLEPAKAPQLRSLLDPAFKAAFGARKEKDAGRTLYSGVAADTPLTVAITYTNRGLQLIYDVKIPDETNKVLVKRASYGLLFSGDPGWDYLTEENAEPSIALLCDCVAEIARLRNALMAVM